MLSPAVAATNVLFNYSSVEADFIPPKAAGTLTRSLSGSGSILFKQDLTNGTYGLSDIASFTLDHRLAATLAAPPFAVSADYNFDTSKLKAFELVIAGGIVTAASWALDPVAWTTSMFNIGFFPQSVEFTFGQGYRVYFTEPGQPRTLLATGIQGSSVIRQSAVPENATWMMMIAGFGLVGASLRGPVRKLTLTR